MKTTTYAKVLQLAAIEAELLDDTAPSGVKLTPSMAAMLQPKIQNHLEKIWQREAWPELCNDFTAVTLTDGAFTTNPATQGALLSLYHGGNPQQTTVCTRIEDWAEGDEKVYVTSELTGTFYAEFQDPVTTLPDYGNTALATTTLPARFLFPLARLAGADLLEPENPAKANSLRALAYADLLEQASQLKTPWWR